MALTSLSFSLINGKYRGRFAATGPFAIEVKGVKGLVGVGINYVGASDPYAIVRGSYSDGKVYVNNFGSGTEVYPMYVEVVCDSLPTYGGYGVSE